MVNSTDKGAVNVREVPNRQQAGGISFSLALSLLLLCGGGGSRDTAARLGIVRKTVYMTLGPYDFVQIIEAPNDEAVAKYVLSINSKGNVRTTTMRAWDEAEHSISAMLIRPDARSSGRGPEPRGEVVALSEARLVVLPPLQRGEGAATQ